MDSISLIGLLGKSSFDAEVEAVLRHYKIRRRPKVEIDEEDLDGPVVEPQDWVIESRVGIEFGFEDEASFHGDDPIEGGLGSMLLTQIYLYGEHEGVCAYQGQLPFGLLMSDDREAVRAKLAFLEGTRRSYVRDVWELPECRLTISYVEDGARIGFILLWSRRNAPPLFESPITMPDIQEIVDALGEDIQGPVVRKVFQQFSLKRYQEDRGLFLRFDFREEYGFELRFMEKFGLSHVVFYRELEMNSCGWRGLLPNALEFNDSPEVLLGKMEQPPDQQNDELFVGRALWDYGSYIIRVNYSTMKNYLLTVELLTQGTLDAYSKG